MRALVQTDWILGSDMILILGEKKRLKLLNIS